MQEEHNGTVGLGIADTTDTSDLDTSMDTPALPEPDEAAAPMASSSGSPGGSSQNGNVNAAGGNGSGASSSGFSLPDVKEVAGQAQQKTGEVLGQVQQQATSRLDQQKQQAAEGLGTVAETLRQTGQQLRDNQQGAIPLVVAQYGEAAAQQVERLSHYLGERDVNQVVHDVEDFARREPAIFLGGAFLLGLLGARFLKSTAPPPAPSNALPSASSASNYGSGSSDYQAGGAGMNTGSSFYPIHQMRTEE